MSRSQQRVCLLALSTWAFAVLAGPQEDYEAGMKARKTGDIVSAMDLLRRAADAGHAQAQAQIAVILDKSEFNTEAVAYYRKSAEQGNADGQLGLGTMYAVGEGVAQDYSEARKWITLAAEQGHKEAIDMLARNYLSGGLGLDPAAMESSVALRWIRLSAENNHLMAVDALAAAYRTGRLGLAIDLQEADRWAAKASKLRGRTDDKDKPKKK